MHHGQAKFVTIGDWVEQIAAQLEQAGLFYGHGTDNAVDEAVWLVLFALQAPLDGSFDRWQDEVGQSQSKRIKALLQERLQSRKPLAYLLGSAWFAGLEFLVNENVLVPRSPIAELVTDGFSPWLVSGQAYRVLDLCTGSGCIAIAAAVYSPQLQVDASDISEPALAVARENVQRHAVSERVRLIQSDLFAALQGECYDLIVSNPPYVAVDPDHSLPDEYQAEPALGLYSGSDGLDLCLSIMLQSPEHLAERGILICEVGESADRLSALLPQVPFLWLEFHAGGDGVFLLSREDLLNVSATVTSLLEERKRVG